MFKKIICVLLVVVFLLATIGCGSKIEAPKQGEAPKLGRVIDHGIFSGVCAGIAYFTGTPTWVWRAGFVVVSAFYGVGIVAYVVLWAFMPEFKSTPADFSKRTGE